jgi:hypothetical protein
MDGIISVLPKVEALKKVSSSRIVGNALHFDRGS